MKKNAMKNLINAMSAYGEYVNYLNAWWRRFPNGGNIYEEEYHEEPD